MTREELTQLVDEVGERFDTLRDEVRQLISERVDQRVAELRGDLLEKLFGLRAPDFQLTPMGELYCDGKKIGDVRPVFRAIVAEVVTPLVTKPNGADHD